MTKTFNNNEFLSSKRQLIKYEIKNLLKIINSIQERLDSKVHDFEGLQASLETSLDTLNDDNYRIGIVGDFSVGKSTFINAFLGDNILQSKNSEATASETVIHFSSKEIIKVKFIDKTSQIYWENGNIYYSNGEKEICSRTDFLKKYTVDEETCRNVSNVDIGLPLQVLHDKWCLFDTPGLNSTNERHTEVTRQIALKCDILMLLTSATNIMTKDFSYFIKEVTGGFIDNCRVIITQIDRIDDDENDIENMKSNAEKRCMKMLGKSLPLWTVSAKKALKAIKENRNDDVNLVQFRQFQTECISQLEESRISIQLLKVCTDIERCIQKIQTAINIITEENRKLYDKKMSETITFDAITFDRIKDNHSRSLKIAIFSLENDYKMKISQCCNGIYYRIRTEIQQCSNKKQLLNFLSGSGINLIKYHFNTKLTPYISDMHKMLKKLYHQSYIEFKQKFDTEIINGDNFNNISINTENFIINPFDFSSTVNRYLSFIYMTFDKLYKDNSSIFDFIPFDLLYNHKKTQNNVIELLQKEINNTRDYLINDVSEFFKDKYQGLSEYFNTIILFFTNEYRKFAIENNSRIENECNKYQSIIDNYKLFEEDLLAAEQRLQHFRQNI